MPSRSKAVFTSAAREESSRLRGGISPRLFYSVFALLFGANVLTATALLLSPEVETLLGGRTEATISAYEQRIVQLRLEVDRLYSRQYAQAGDLNLQLQEIAQQQDVLSEQHQYVRALVTQASALGLAPAAPVPLSRHASVDVAEALAYAPAPSAPTEPIAAAEAELSAMMTETDAALAALSVAARQSTEEIVTALGTLGIRPTLPDAEAGTGGPYVPAPAEFPASAGLDEINAVAAALARFKAARGAIDTAPIHAPIAGASRMSSNFGTRRDPFNGRPAFHAGIDFAMPSGTTVLAAGAGKVSFVGQRSGYGNVVEVTHGGGLLTRYAHLSRQLAREGQLVEAGTPIGKVGSTGRSTGPHLHFEVRRGEQPLDPSRFIAAGRKLARYMAE